MTQDEIKSAPTFKLLALVFGKKPGQTLQQFADECKSVKDDEKFVAEVREYALAHGVQS